MRSKTLAYMIKRGNLSPDKTVACTTHPDYYTLWKIKGVEKDPILVENSNNFFDKFLYITFIPEKQNLLKEDVDKLLKKGTYKGKEFLEII